MFRTSALALVGILCCTTLSQAATQIDVGDHLLLPNTPNQKIEIFVTGTGDDRIQGAVVFAQIGDDPLNAAGVPVFQFLSNPGPTNYPGPNLSTLLAPGSIFASVPSSENNPSSLQFPTHMQISGRAFQVTVPDGGLLATLYIDTTGIFTGQWALALGNTVAGPTNWAGSVVFPRTQPDTFVPDPVIIDGSITIVPEPSSIALGVFAVISLCAVALRRR